MVSETITVTWAGVERTAAAEHSNRSCFYGVTPVLLQLHKSRRAGSDPQQDWVATIDVPVVEPRVNFPCLVSNGPTPQAALDDLAAKLRALAAWALATVGADKQ